MTDLTLLGEFPQVAIALTLSLGCALLPAFVSLADCRGSGNARTV